MRTECSSPRRVKPNVSYRTGYRTGLGPGQGRALRTGRSISVTDEARGSTAHCSGMLPTAPPRARRAPASGVLCERAIAPAAAARGPPVTRSAISL